MKYSRGEKMQMVLHSGGRPPSSTDVCGALDSKSAPHVGRAAVSGAWLALLGLIQNRIARSKSMESNSVCEAGILKKLAATGPFSVGYCFLRSGEGPEGGGGHMDPPSP